MKITKTTTYGDVMYLFKRIDIIDKTLKKITAEDVAAQNYGSLQSYTLHDYFELTSAIEEGDISFLFQKYFPKLSYKTKAYDILCRFKWIIEEKKMIAQILKQCEIKGDAIEEKAAKMVIQPHRFIRIASFMVRRFNLHSYEEAEQRKVAEYLGEIQIVSAEAKIERIKMDLRRKESKQ